jgi:hypothetical protein
MMWRHIRRDVTAPCIWPIARRPSARGSLFLLSPLVGEGGRGAKHRGRVRGSGPSIDRAPSSGAIADAKHRRSKNGGRRPPIATFSHRGEGKETQPIQFSNSRHSPPSLRAKRSNPSCGTESVDCFVASLLAMTTSRHTSAISRRYAPELCLIHPPSLPEGAGNAGCLAHPQPRVRMG